MKQSISLLILAFCGTFFATTTLAVPLPQKPGQFEPIPVNDSALLESLRLVESVYLPILNAGNQNQGDNNNGEYFRRGQIHSAGKQLVAGLNYQASFDFYENTCTKSGCLINCIVKRKFLCTVTISREFDQANKKVFLKNFSCDQMVVKKNTPIFQGFGATGGEGEGEKVGKC